MRPRPPSVPRPARRAALTALAALAALASPARAAVTACPASTIEVGAPVTNSLAVRETTVVTGGGVVLTAAYDLPQGAAAVSMTPTALLQSRVVAVDRYRFSGLPAGPASTVTVALEVDGYVATPGCGGSGCAGWFGAVLASGGASSSREVSVGFTGRRDLVETLTLPLDVTDGEEREVSFELYVRSRPGASHGGAGTARITFTGLPPGARVGSCQGFTTGVVPARPGTWGMLKLRYR